MLLMDEDNHTENEATDFPAMEESSFFLSAEDGELARHLSEYGELEFARIMLGLSDRTKNEIRAAIGTLEAWASLHRDQPKS
jgi:hypothetical protein